MNAERDRPKRSRNSRSTKAPRALPTSAMHEVSSQLSSCFCSSRLSRALMSLRIEKGYRAWKGDLSTDYSMLEGGLDRFIKFDKPQDFHLLHDFCIHADCF